MSVVVTDTVEVTETGVAFQLQACETAASVKFERAAGVDTGTAAAVRLANRCQAGSAWVIVSVVGTVVHVVAVPELKVPSVIVSVTGRVSVTGMY